MAEAPGRDFLHHDSAFHFQQIAGIYGSHLPFRLLMERNLVASQSRMGGLPSSNLSMEVLTGRELDLPFPSYLHPDLTNQLPSVERKAQWLE